MPVSHQENEKCCELYEKKIEVILIHVKQKEMEKLNSSEIETKLKDLNGWNYQNGSICKSFVFKDFKEAFSVMTHIAFEAEQQNHHPNWENVYNQLTVKLNTHDAGGITQYDFDLAKTIENIVGNS